MTVCPIMHEYAADHGWEVLSVTYRKQRTHTHVVPCADIRRHQLDPTCWCDPEPVEDAIRTWSHNSADGRERFETGEQAAN